jgi:GNAT superfamily N-acetyltransferase
MTLAATLDRLDTWWAAALGCDVTDFQRGRTLVAGHGAALSGYPGLFALARNRSCIISAPPARFASAAALLAGHPPRAAFEGDVLRQAFLPRDSMVIGPAWLGYADRTDIHAADGRDTRLLAYQDAAALRALEAACDPVDWEHSGIDADHDLLFGRFHGPVLVAAGTCRRAGEGVLDIGIVTHPSYRGHGYGRAVVSAMTAYGLAHGHVMRYRTLQANVPSLRIARALGYQEYGLTIAVRPVN